MKKTLAFLFLCLFLFTSNVGNILAAVYESFPATSSQASPEICLQFFVELLSNPSPCGYSQPHPNPLLEERE